MSFTFPKSNNEYIPNHDVVGEKDPLLLLNKNKNNSNIHSKTKDSPPTLPIDITTTNTNNNNNNNSYKDLFSKLTFQWILPLLHKGNIKDQLQLEDLKDIPLPISCQTDFVSRYFEYYWNDQVVINKMDSSTNKHYESYDDNDDHDNDNQFNTDTNYNHQQQQPQQQQQPSLTWCLIHAFSSEYIKAGILKLIHDLNLFIGPNVLHALIQFLRNNNNEDDNSSDTRSSSSSSSSIYQGLYLIAILTLSQIIMSLCLRHYFFKCYITGLRMRTAIVMAIYKKALVISSTERQKRTIGEIVNLMTIDAQRIQDVTTYGHAVWYSFLQIGLAIYFIWRQLGPSCLAGVLVIVIMIPINRILASWMGTLQERLMEARDQRVDVNNEVLGSMKVIKLQAWEDSFKKRIKALREVELKRLCHYVMLDAFSIMMWTAVPIFVAVATFAAYTLSGHPIDIARALTTLALFDILRFPLFMLPQVINNFVEASVSLNRVQNFLLGGDYSPVSEGNIVCDAGIEIHNATFSYESKLPNMQQSEEITENSNMKINSTATEKKVMSMDRDSQINDVIEGAESGRYDNLFELRQINFKCKRGELIAIVGSVGVGKTTFLNAILGEVQTLSGTTAVKGKLAYCPQLPFIMNDTVENNSKFPDIHFRAKYLSS